MIGLLRDVSPRLDSVELPNGIRIDVKLARKQHTDFAGVLKELGVTIEFVPALPENPEGVFLAGAAILLREVALIARPHAVSRQPEIETVATSVAAHRPVVRILGAVSLHADDVLRIGRTLFVGTSALTSADAIPALADAVEPYGYDVCSVDFHGCAHLKTACSFVPPHYVVLNPAFIEMQPFAGLTTIPVDHREPLAANTLTIGGTTLVSSAFPSTEKRLSNFGVRTRTVDVSEFHKANASVSSLVLIIEPRTVRPSAQTVGFRVVRSASSPLAPGVFASAIVHGGVVYVSGQLPIDPATGAPVDGGIDKQTEQVLSNLCAVLAASGSSEKSILRLTVYVSDAKAVDRVTAACARAFDGHTPAASIVPARTLQSGCLVAADAIAAVVENEVSHRPDDRVAAAPSSSG